jgi:uncharacterized protein
MATVGIIGNAEETERGRKRWTRIGRLIGGWTLIGLGFIGLFIPLFPTVSLVIAGLALMASEYVWARRAMVWVKQRLQRAKRAVSRKQVAITD